MNELPEKRFNELDDLLAFISIYDDENRTRAYLNMLKHNRDRIANKICVEAGCGFGLISEYMAKLGASKVYAVEMNPQLFQIARQRLGKYSNVEVIYADILDFHPREKIDVLVHELFGQLLFDEDIYTLERLNFSPDIVLPDKAVLMGGCIDSEELVDDTVTPEILQKLDGALVSGLFDDEDMELTFPVAPWQYGASNYEATCDISSQQGDLLFMGLHILHNERIMCRAGECSNWSYVWTPRCGDRFALRFVPSSRGTQVFFDWLDHK